MIIHLENEQYRCNYIKLIFLKGLSEKLVRIGKKKYMFPPNKAKFEDAKKVCDGQGLQISTIENGDEEKSIADYLKYIGKSDTMFFLNIKPLTAGKKGYTWSKQKSPSGSGKCSAILEGALLNTSCEIAANFLCKENAESAKGNASSKV